MNRETKFRAWVPDEKKIYDVLSIDFIENSVVLFKNGPLSVSYDLGVVELMQFTGLKDKNGFEVYEGGYLLDRWEEDGETFVDRYPVVWDSENMQWAIDASFKKDGSFLVPVIEYFGSDIEVSGNRFENPEMIEQ